MLDEEWKLFMDRMPGDYITDPQTYILRWNPTISSFKLEHYRKACTYTEGFSMNWSIYEWEKAKKGDRFYMERLGDDGKGIVFRGSSPLTLISAKIGQEPAENVITLTLIASMPLLLTDNLESQLMN